MTDALSARPLALLACLFLWLGAAITAAPAAQTGELTALRRHALQLVNEARRERGLDPLSFSDPLNAAAQAHAQDMLERDYYSHLSPEGEAAMDRFLAHGGDQWRLVAENITTCSPCAETPNEARVGELHRGWMDSPGHRENILRPGVTRFGFGVVAGDDGPLYAVQTFAGPGASGDGGGAGAGELAAEDLAPAFARALNDRREAASAPALEVAPVLTALAAQLLPGSAEDAVDLNRAGGPREALPPDQRGDWTSLLTLTGSCGGCGATANEDDVRRFLDLWLDDREYAADLTGEGPDAVGFALRAYGNGRKTAVAVLGERR